MKTNLICIIVELVLNLQLLLLFNIFVLNWHFTNFMETSLIISTIIEISLKFVWFGYVCSPMENKEYFEENIIMQIK